MLRVVFSADGLPKQVVIDGVKQSLEIFKNLRRDPSSPWGMRDIERHKIKKEEWPMILLPLKVLAVNGDLGAGDIIARVVGPIGGEAFKKWYKLMFRKDCGCGNRQDALNRRWPL